MIPSGTPVNKKMTLERLFNNVPSFIAFDDVEALDETATDISATEMISKIDITGVQVNVDMDLSAFTHEGQLKIIVRINDGETELVTIDTSNFKLDWYSIKQQHLISRR